MEAVRVTCHGIVAGQNSLITRVEGLHQHWQAAVTLEPGARLGNLMEALADMPRMNRLSNMLVCDVESFLAEVGQAPSLESVVEDDIDYLEVYNAHYPSHRGGVGAISREFHGWGLWPEETEMAGNVIKGPVAIEFIPLPDLLRHELRYNSRLEIYAEERPRAWTNIVARISVDITLGDLLQAIFWEIGFHGSPQRRDEACQEWEDRRDELDKKGEMPEDIDIERHWQADGAGEEGEEA